MADNTDREPDIDLDATPDPPGFDAASAAARRELDRMIAQNEQFERDLGIGQASRADEKAFTEHTNEVASILQQNDRSNRQALDGVQRYVEEAGREKAAQVAREERSLVATEQTVEVLRAVGDSLEALQKASVQDADRSKLIINQNWAILAVAVLAVVAAIVVAAV